MSYKKWRCIVCDFIYDEAKGIPEEGIAPGTRWEDVPDEWLCPDCGVGKVDFDMVEIRNTSDETVIAEHSVVTSHPEIDNSKRPVIIIGSGLAGYQLAREFRKLDNTTPLTIISSDDGSLYSKPQLSTGFSNRKTSEQLVTASAEAMAEELRARILTYAKVSAIQAEDNAIIVNGCPIHYSKLVLATGARSVRLQTDGDAGADIFYVNSLQDYSRFRTSLVNKKRILIVGAGLIGSEYANDLIQAGYEVAVIDREDGPLRQVLPCRLSDGLQSALEQAGVRYYRNTALKSVTRQSGQVIAELDDGTTVETDIVLSAIGLKPRTELAEQAGISVNHGICTDQQLQTSIPNIYALGDCAEVNGRVLCYIAPLMAAARALAKTLAGESTQVHYDVMPVTVKTSLYPLLVSAPPHGITGEWVVSGDGSNLNAQFYSADGELLGFALSGNLSRQKQLIPTDLAPIMPAD